MSPDRRSLYVPLNVYYWRDVTAAGLTQNAGVLYQLIISEVKMLGTDGLISRSTIRQLGVNGYWHSLRLLIRSGWILDKGDDLFYVAAWLKWNDSLDDINARRKADRDRKRVKRSVPKSMFKMPD